MNSSHACAPFPSHAPGVPYTMSELVGVCAGDYSKQTGFGNNTYNFTAGFCSMSAVGNNPANPTGGMQLCSSGACTESWQKDQCNGPTPPLCSASTVASSSAPLQCEYDCTPSIKFPTMKDIDCISKITSGSCGGGNAPAGCPNCAGAKLTSCSVLPAPNPVPPPVPTDWSQHRCGSGGLTSSMPNPPILGLKNFDQAMNPMAVCCWNGWTQATDPSSFKLDCIERFVTEGEDFLKFYYEGGPRGTPPSTSPDYDRYAGVTYPNQLFMLNAAGTSCYSG